MGDLVMGIFEADRPMSRVRVLRVRVCAGATSDIPFKVKRASCRPAIELRRLFPGVTDNAKARECARTIAGWKPLRAPACQITPLRLRGSRARPAKP
jgi:hypothetical protein